MARVAYAGCLHDEVPGTALQTETTGPTTGEPILVGAFAIPDGVATAVGAGFIAPGATIPQATPMIVAAATVTSPAAAVATRGRVWANVPPIDAILVAGVGDIVFDLRLQYTIGATTANLLPARRWGWNTAAPGAFDSYFDLGQIETAWAPVAAGQTITATAQLRFWGTHAGGPNMGSFGPSSIAVGWEAR